MEGTVQKTNEGYVLRFERHLKHPIENVWAAITQPEQLAQWLAHAEVELFAGGKLNLHFQNTGDKQFGQVLQAKPPQLIEFTWNNEEVQGSVVRFELHPEADGCLLTLTHTFPIPVQVAMYLAGWHTHLEILDSTLSGQPMEWPWHRWEELRDQYEAKIKEA